MVAEAKPKLFSVEDYHRMGEAGILAEDDRLELVDGEVVEMSPIGGQHMNCVNLLNRFLSRHCGDDVVVSVQNPIRLGDRSEPQPDIALIRWGAKANRLTVPGPSQVLLVIEVSDTTLPYDRDVKLPLYAGAGIPEAWIFDLQGGAIVRHTEPVGDAFCLAGRAGKGQQLQSIILPGLTLCVDDYFS